MIGSLDQKKLMRILPSLMGLFHVILGLIKMGVCICLVKWQSKAHHANCTKLLEAREQWPHMLAYLCNIANMKTSTTQTLEIF